MPTIKEAASEFLARKRVAVTGVSREAKGHGSNVIGLHRVTVTAIEAPTLLRVGALEGIDGTPILDLKAVLNESRDE